MWARPIICYLAKDHVRVLGLICLGYGCWAHWKNGRNYTSIGVWVCYTIERPMWDFPNTPPFLPKIADSLSLPLTFHFLFFSFLCFKLWDLKPKEFRPKNSISGHFSVISGLRPKDQSWSPLRALRLQPIGILIGLCLDLHFFNNSLFFKRLFNIVSMPYYIYCYDFGMWLVVRTTLYEYLLTSKT